MANIDDMLKKHSGRLDKIKAPKRIERRGPTRPWQENLEKNQSGPENSDNSLQSKKAPRLAKTAEERPKSAPDQKDSNSQNEDFRAKDLGAAVEAELNTAENRSTEIQPRHNAENTNKNTEIQSTGFRSSNIQPTGKQPSKDMKAEIQTTEFQSTEKQPTENSESRGDKTVENRSTGIQPTELSAEIHSTGIQPRPLKKMPPPKETAGNQSSDFQSTEKRSSSPKAFQISYNGFFPLHCESFQPDLFVRLNPGEFKLLLYMSFLVWRYPEKPGHIRASIPYLENGTGIKRTAVQTHLKNLIELKFIELAEQNKKLGNLYKISHRMMWNNSSKIESGRDENSEFQSTTDKTSEIQSTEKHPLDNRNPTVGQPENSLPSTVFRYKEYTYYTSLDILDSRAENYLNQLKPKKRRLAERSAYKSLIEEFPKEEILIAYEYIENQGDLSRGEKCHMPMNYLSKALPDVLDRIRHDSHKKILKTELNKREEQNRLQEQTKKQIENQAWQSKVNEFEKAYPSIDEQNRVIQSFIEKMPMKIDSKALRRSVAIEKWWDEREQESKS